MAGLFKPKWGNDLQSQGANGRRPAPPPQAAAFLAASRASIASDLGVWGKARPARRARGRLPLRTRNDADEMGNAGPAPAGLREAPPDTFRWRRTTHRLLLGPSAPGGFRRACLPAGRPAKTAREPRALPVRLPRPG